MLVLQIAVRRFSLMALFFIPAISFGIDRDPIEPKTLSSHNGRYVFGQVSPGSVNQFMLDTQTGRLWRMNTKTWTLEDVLYSRLYSDAKEVVYSFFPQESTNELITVPAMPYKAEK